MCHSLCNYFAGAEDLLQFTSAENRYYRDEIIIAFEILLRQHKDQKIYPNN